VGEIFRVDENDLPWAEYEEAGGSNGRAHVRVKALTLDEPDVPPVQFVEYAPGHTDPVHSHKTDEFFIVTDGELWLDGALSGPGSIVFIPRNTEYSVRGGDRGVRYFRIVVR
jgi:quercetin dioxygenase-like cupin family protein